MKIACDPAAAAAAMDTIGQRHEAMMDHVWMAIHDGINAQTLSAPYGSPSIRPIRAEAYSLGQFQTQMGEVS